MRTKIWMALATGLLLAACGGGGPATPSSEPAAAPVAAPAKTACVPKKKPVRVQLFSDSTGLGYVYGLMPDPYTLIPSIDLQAALDAKFGVGAATVENRSASGMGSDQLIAGTDGVNLPWPHSTDADVVIFGHGINDAQQQIGHAQYQANIRTVAAGPWVTIFETPSPNWNRVIEDDDYAEAMREEAQVLGAPLADTNAWMNALPGWRNLVPDGIHPNEDGYHRISENVLEPVVVPVVAGLLCQ